jgi:20S proteasome subunit beta 7
MSHGFIERKIVLCILFFPPPLLSRFLSFVDLLGTTYSASTLATGYGAHIAQPLLRKAVEGREDILTEEQAHKIIENSMRVLYYRDARSINKVTLSASISSFNLVE